MFDAKVIATNKTHCTKPHKKRQGLLRRRAVFSLISVQFSLYYVHFDCTLLHTHNMHTIFFFLQPISRTFLEIHIDIHKSSLFLNRRALRFI